MAKNSLPKELESLYEVAKKARLNSHSPHSGYKVGAALKTKSGKVFPGCNVENSSYGATVCAERGAIQTAIAAEGKLAIEEILVVTDSNPPWMPCALCRQVISEFLENSGGDLKIHATNLEGACKTVKFTQLYPDAFTPTELHEGRK